MKERVVDFEERTGRPYRPSAGRGKRLSSRQWCPTLFRFPGPLGLLKVLRGGDARLTEGPGPVWLSGTPTHVPGAELFGTLALLQPLHAMPVRAPEKGAFWIDHAVPTSQTGVVWVPPDSLGSVPFDSVQTPDALRDHIGSDYAEMLHAHLEELGRYSAELHSLAAVGAEAPAEPWFSVPAVNRHALLSRHGVRGPWSEGGTA